MGENDSSHKNSETVKECIMFHQHYMNPNNVKSTSVTAVGGAGTIAKLSKSALIGFKL